MAADRFGYYSIGHSFHRFMNPTSIDRLMELGWACGLEPKKDAPESFRLANVNLGLFPGARLEPHYDGTVRSVLDVGCGKGGVAYLWAENFLAECKGVDLSEGEIKQALERQRLSVAMEMVDFTLGDGASYVKALVTEGKRFDVALCIGATFIFGSFEKTVMALGQCLKEDGVMAIGEVTLNEFCGAEEFAREMKASEGLELRTDSEILCVIERMGLDLTYVADSTPTDWDRYESLQYTALYQYYREHPGDDEARAHWGRAKRNKARYLGKERTHMGWKIFVLRPLPTAPPAPPAPA